MDLVNTVLSIPHLVINIVPDITTLSRLCRCNKDFYSRIKVDDYINDYLNKFIDNSNAGNYTEFTYLLGLNNKRIPHGNYLDIEPRNYGVCIIETTYNKGKKHGYKYVYTIRRETIDIFDRQTWLLRAKLHYVNGNRTGPQYEYSTKRNRQVYLKEYYYSINNNRHGEYYKFDECGNVIEYYNYINGVYQGKYIDNRYIQEYYHGYLVLEHGTYINSIKHGPFVCYDLNNNIHSKGCYVNERMHGPYIQWYGSTLIIDRVYNHGRKDGICKRWWYDYDIKSNNRLQLNLKFYTNGVRRKATLAESIKLLLEGININNPCYYKKVYKHRIYLE